MSKNTENVESIRPLLTEPQGIGALQQVLGDRQVAHIRLGKIILWYLHFYFRNYKFDILSFDISDFGKKRSSTATWAASFFHTYIHTYVHTYIHRYMRSNAKHTWKRFPTRQLSIADVAILIFLLKKHDSLISEGFVHFFQLLILVTQ
jgi:hypothetical protein